MAKFFRSLPLMAIPLIAYNLIIWLTADDDPVTPLLQPEILHTLLFELTLPSQALWQISWAHGLMALGLVCLALEIIRASNIRDTAIFDHVFSFLVAMVYLVEFIIYAPAGHVLFFMLMLMSFIDVITGTIISLRAARRDITMGGEY